MCVGMHACAGSDASPLHACLFVSKISPSILMNCCTQNNGPAELSCLLTASHDQKVAIWTMAGTPLGSLRQGERAK
jgi:hypothetical protein